MRTMMRAIEMLVVKTAWILSNSFIPQEMGEMRGMRRMRTMRMAIEMLVVKTGSFILSFILSRDEEDEKDEDRATHCSRQSQMSSYS